MWTTPKAFNSVLGKVRLNGKGSSKFKVGDRVACLSKYEGQAELINLPERFLVPIPEGVDLKAAVALVLDWVTAYQMLHHSGHVKSGQKIFVHGLSGAVGGALLSLGRIQGAQVFGTASPSKHEELCKLGAIPLDYANKKWIMAMQALGGVDAVFDPLGYESFDESYSVLRKGGILVARPHQRSLQRQRSIGEPDAHDLVPGHPGDLGNPQQSRRDRQVDAALGRAAPKAGQPSVASRLVVAREGANFPAEVRAGVAQIDPGFA